MIPILYPKTETAFTSVGIGKLAEATRCEVTEERNGEYELVLEYPVGGKYAADITEGAYILAKHDDGTDLQPFQIYKISTPLEGKITVNAWHISYALTSIILKPYTAGSLAAALSGITTNSMNANPFTFWTDKTMTADFKLEVPASVRSVLGGMAGSILDIYGPGEYEFDKYTVKFYANRGSNKGVSIRYRKNLTSLDKEINASEKFNAVMPYWTGSDSKVVSDALVVRTGETADRAIALDLSSEFETEPTVAELKSRAQTIIDGSANYRVRENIKVDFVPLWQTEEYKTVAALQRVMLCDTVNIFYEKLGINATAKCIKVVYDTLRERYNSIELGEPKKTLGDQIRGEITQEITEKVPTKGFIETAIEQATELIAGGFGGYIKFNYLPDGTPSEMLIMDSPDESTAVNIIRLNQNGLGFSTDGGSTYANAWTIDGNLNADFITAGILNAARIQAGLLQDASGENYWNLDTGQFVTKQGEIADFDIHTDELLGGNYGFNDVGTRIKRGSFSTTYLMPYTISGQVQLYTHFSSYGTDIAFYITAPSRTTYPLLPAEQAGRIAPNYNATLDFRELEFYGGKTKMFVLRDTSTNPFISFLKHLQIGSSSNMLDNFLFGSLQIRNETGTDGTYLSGKGAAFGKSAITDNLVDSAWDIKSAGQIWSEKATGDGLNSAIVAKSQTNAALTAYNETNANYIELVDGSSGRRGLYTDSGWMLYLGTDGEIYFGKPVDATNLPVASATQAGIVSTGAQTFAGAKTFTSSPTVSSAGSDTNVKMSVSSNSANVEYHAYKANYGGRAYINEVSGKSDGTGSTGYYERYFLPTPDADRTSHADYGILTSKEAVTIARGGTGATTAAAARSNLGLGASANLLSGTLTTTEVTLSGAAGYTALCIIGQPSGGAYSSITLPMSTISTTAYTWQLADNTNYETFSIRKSGSDVMIKKVASSGSAVINEIRGII